MLMYIFVSFYLITNYIFCYTNYRAVEYVQKEAPIILHFKPVASLNGLAKDGKYKNFMETGFTNGSSDKDWRTFWEVIYSSNMCNL